MAQASSSPDPADDGAAKLNGSGATPPDAAASLHGTPVPDSSQENAPSVDGAVATPTPESATVGNSSPKKDDAKRIRRPDEILDELSFSLLRLCAPEFARGRHVSHAGFLKLVKLHAADPEIAQLGKTLQSKTAFKDACIRLTDLFAASERLYKPLGLPVPQATYTEEGLFVPARPFLVHYDRSKELCELADALVNHKLDDKRPLLARSGHLYFGFGATSAAAAESCWKHEQHDFVFSTASVDLMLRYMVNAAGRHKGSFEFSRDQIDCNHGSGFPISEKGSITTSIVSFERVDKKGTFFADAPEKRAALERALKRTKDVVILIGSISKFRQEGSDRLRLRVPKKKGVKYYLFTNGNPGPEFKIPDYIELIIAPPSNPPPGASGSPTVSPRSGTPLTPASVADAVDETSTTTSTTTYSSPTLSVVADAVFEAAATELTTTLPESLAAESEGGANENHGDPDDYDDNPLKNAGPNRPR